MMYNISNYVRKNKERAVELLKENNKFSFDLEDLDGDEIPYVICAFGGLCDCAVNKINYDAEKDLFYLKVIDMEYGGIYEIDETDCIQGTENDVFMWIGEEFNEEIV